MNVPEILARPRRSVVPYLFASLAAVACASGGARHSSAARAVPAAETISRVGLIETVAYLASPELKGRLPGHEGYDRAARYAAERMKAAELEPAGGEGYFQHLDVEVNEIHACEFSIPTAAGASRALELGKDFACRGFTGSGTVEAPVVFCGYGLSMPERGYDDYAGVDVRGKIVLAFKNAPEWKIDASGWDDAHLPRFKSRVAADHGAAGILLVSTPNAKDPQKPIGSLMHGKGEQNERFPQIHFDIPVAEDLLRGRGQTLAELQTAIDRARAPRSIELGGTARLEVSASYSRAKDTVNVIGVLRGTDPRYREEFIVVGAHLDHVGSQGERIYYPGANDNASGSAAVLALADAFARVGVSPRRSIVFVLFASEEQGLDGAKKYVAAPPFPLARTVAMINIDCIGLGDGIQLGGGKDAPVLWKMARRIDRKNFRATIEETWGGGGADATPFREAGIPTLYVATTHSFAHLHLPSDTVDTLDGALFEKTVRLAFLTVAEIAFGDYVRELPPTR
jgi:hypothetical protein